MNDALIAVAAWVQHVEQPLNVARCTSTLAASARLNVANVTGVVKPSKPGTNVKGNAAPPAWRSVYAVSSIAETSAIASANATNGAGGSEIGRSTATGMPVGPLRIARV